MTRRTTRSMTRDMPRQARGLRRAAPQGLYLIGDARLAGALCRGVAAAQYRDKTAAPRERERAARLLARRARAHGAVFVVNDDVELAAQVGADGVHLGARDAPLAAARRHLGPDAWLGATCGASIEAARRAQRDGANYVSFGAVFASRTKPAAGRIGLATLAHCARRAPAPVCAIGGVNLGNARRVAATGVALVAVAGVARRGGLRATRALVREFARARRR